LRDDSVHGLNQVADLSLTNETLRQLVSQLQAKMIASLKINWKAAALREAHRSIVTENQNLHPAFWGVFQLVGNANPLSR